MISELHRRGWRLAKARVLHEEAVVGVMDSREATRMKAYYVVLLEVTRCMPLAIRGIPSDQPIVYYKLLLKGTSVDHGLGAIEYRRIMNELPPAPAPVPPIGEGDSDDDWLTSGAGALPLQTPEEASEGEHDDPRGRYRPPLPPPSTASSSSAKASAKTKAAPTTPTPPVLTPPPAPPTPAPPSPPSAGDILMGGVAVPKGKAKAKGPKRDKPPPVPAVGEGFVSYDDYRAPCSVSSYWNCTFFCNRDGCPKDCKRTVGVAPRNMKLLKTDIEHLAFLHAWRDCEIDKEKGHRKSDVPNQAVKDFHADHYDELIALRDMVLTP
jgi:hypothetical protein